MDFRLNDDEILAFIARGYHIFHPAIDADIHQAVCAHTHAAFVEGKNPGNAIYEQVPALVQVLSHPQVVGALTSILGADYHMLCHRHAHLTQPGQAAGGFHQDGTPRALRGWTRPWRYGHRPRKVLLVYFPHAVPKELGPTTLVPGSQYYRQRPEAMESLECEVEGDAGVMAICHFSSWHRAGANVSDTERIMLKFVFDRRDEPHEPSWQAAASYNPDFAATARQWSAHPDGRLLCLPKTWQTMWNWLGGRGAERLGGTASMESLFQNLASDQEHEALEAAYSLGGQVDADEAQALVARMRHGDEQEREMAAVALSAAGRVAVAALRETLADPDPWLRAMAADIAGDLGRESLALIPDIERAIDDEDVWVRHNALQALALWGREAHGAEDRVVEALTDAEPFVRFNALGALMSMRPLDAHCAEWLQHVAANDEAHPQWRAQDALLRWDNAALRY